MMDLLSGFFVMAFLVYIHKHSVVCFAFSSAILPSSVPGTLRQDDYNQTCANLEIWRFRCDLHGRPVPLQWQDGCVAAKAWPADCEYITDCIPV